ncbi:MAG TPA: nicotinate-nucleotide adenylyltransferase [Chthoniobacteraceae bacterium]|nr:nicotinate-nucleotide adenylyltransferase [Chthoniobacteraceae bacterium]
MKLALYGGTFDPIHHGHLILAREAVEQLGLDRVVFIPAAQSPFKPTQIAAPADIRVAMVRTAIAEEEAFVLDESEIHRGGTSYTIDTVEAARARWPGAELWWLIGEDHLDQLPKWHRYEELKHLVRFAVFARAGNGAVDHDFPRITRRLDISATEIRTRVARGDSIRYLVPPAVLALIEENRLYRLNS